MSKKQNSNNNHKAHLTAARYVEMKNIPIGLILSPLYY